MLTVCLDPGHGGEDPGAVRDGLAEKTLSLAIASAARDLLSPHARVVLTRDHDITLSLEARRVIARRAQADLFVSIHVNAAPSPRASGCEAHVRPGAGPLSAALASALLLRLVERWPERPTRGVRQSRLAVLHQECPACLIECFFLSNAADRALLRDPASHAALGAAIALGCRDVAPIAARATAWAGARIS